MVKNLQNWANRTLWTGDNLAVMRGMNSHSVDLIYLDPPFNKNETYSAPIGSEAAGAAFKDSWTLSDVDLVWHGEIAEQSPPLYAVVDAAGHAHGNSMKSYLIMMAVRLLEMKRILKPTGSIYLHCDATAGHYLKMTMDCIFGAEQFRNDIAWRRATAHNDASRYGNIVDTILFYANGGIFYWAGEQITQPKTADELKKSYPSKDERGQYRAGDLTGPLHAMAKGTPSTLPWRGYDVYARGRCWAVPKEGKYAKYIDKVLLPGYSKIEGIHARLDALDAAGLIHHPKKGVWPGLKRYADADQGKLPQNLILAPIGFTNYSPKGEYTGYPTQKPLALLDQFIRASCPPGGIVFDPFCGCATALIAADRVQRQWVGIDLSPMALDLVKSRLENELGLFYDVIHRIDVPERVDYSDIEWQAVIAAKQAVKPYSCKENKQWLFGKQQGVCYGCNNSFPYKIFEVDHIVPQVNGGGDELANLQLLCNACNRSKGALSLDEFSTRTIQRMEKQLAELKAMQKNKTQSNHH